MDSDLLARRLEREKRARHSAEAIVEQKSRELYDSNQKLQQANRELEIQAEELRKARDAALGVARLKAQFLANMSHEIRTPMNGIVGMTALLLGTNLTPEQRDFTETIRSSAEALRAIVDDVLDLSKIEAGALSLRPVDFDLGVLLNRALDVFREVAGSKQLELLLRMNEDLPRMLHGDEGRLRQILVNLIGNAVKFTERGSVVVEVSHERESETRTKIRFTVRDTGIGIPLQSQAALFQPFWQADGSTTRRYGGTGLGLTISKSLVDLLGGEIGFESTPEQGSTFWFTAALDTVTEAPAAPEAPPLHTAPPEAPKLGRILVAEDNAVNRKIAVLFLERLGYAVDAVENGLDAVVAAQFSKYDLILMDCQMPEMDGYEAAREIRQAEAAGRPHVPMLALTAHAMAGDREKCLAAGMDGYISKPFSLATLQAAVNKWLVKGATAES